MRRLVCCLALIAAFTGSAGWAQETAPADVSAESGQTMLIRKVAPVYPPLARQARIQGTVVLKILINKDGDVRNIQLVSGHPMLAPAAIEAVKQWKYQPYSKDGEVVEVSTTVRVNFALGAPAPNDVVGAIGGWRVSEAEMRALRIQEIDPVYPPLAIQERLQGEVILDAQISASGDVQDVLMISGHPMLTVAAIEAVKQWKYRPYVVNGNAVAVSSMVRLRFTLTENGTVGAVSEPEPLQTMKPTSMDGAPRAAFPTRVRVSSGVSQGLLVRKVPPEYPEDAREQHIQGTVILQVSIDKEGNVETLELVSGHPALAPAAIEAVRQWKYRPYLLNGNAVEVDTQVQVNFMLQ